jgi:hypothetical protein
VAVWLHFYTRSRPENRAPGDSGRQVIGYGKRERERAACLFYLLCVLSIFAGVGLFGCLTPCQDEFLRVKLALGYAGVCWRKYSLFLDSNVIDLGIIPTDGVSTYKVTG